MQLRWLTSTSTSALHAPTALAAGRELTDPKLAAELAQPVQYLDKLTELAGSRAPFLLNNLLGLSASLGGNRQLAEVTLQKSFDAGRSPIQVAQLATVIDSIEAAFARAVPDSVDQLTLRTDPLRGQWEARGPGLLHMVGKLTDPGLLVDAADVILLQPVLGGGGAAHVFFNAVRFEAVLANPLPQLPEVLRLGWLLAQLNLDLPMYQGRLTRDTTITVGGLALLPAVLAAGQEVELCRHDAATMQAALQAWTPEGASTDEAGWQSLSEVLNDWWAAYRANPPRFEIALAALQKMLSE